MADVVLLEYTFMFDPSETWGHIYQFEESFAAYLKTIGFQATVVKSVDGGNGKRILMIAKAKPMEVAPLEEIKQGSKKVTVGEKKK